MNSFPINPRRHNFVKQAGHPNTTPERLLYLATFGGLYSQRIGEALWCNPSLPLIAIENPVIYRDIKKRLCVVDDIIRAAREERQERRCYSFEV